MAEEELSDELEQEWHSWMDKHPENQIVKKAKVLKAALEAWGIHWRLRKGWWMRDEDRKEYRQIVRKYIPDDASEKERGQINTATVALMRKQRREDNIALIRADARNHKWARNQERQSRHPSSQIADSMSPTEYTRRFRRLKHLHHGPGGGEDYIDGGNERFPSPFDRRPSIYPSGTTNVPLSGSRWSDGGPGGVKKPNIPGGGGGK